MTPNGITLMSSSFQLATLVLPLVVTSAVSTAAAQVNGLQKIIQEPVVNQPLPNSMDVRYIPKVARLYKNIFQQMLKGLQVKDILFTDGNPANTPGLLQAIQLPS